MRTTTHTMAVAAETRAAGANDLVSRVIRTSATAGLLTQAHLEFEIGPDGNLRTRAVRPSFDRSSRLARLRVAAAAADGPSPRTA